MTDERRAAALVDHYFDTLAHDPAAAPPPGLDPESVRIVGAVVAEQRRAEGNPGVEQAQARVWGRVMGSIPRPDWWASVAPSPLGERVGVRGTEWRSKHHSRAISRRSLLPIGAIAAVLLLAYVLWPSPDVIRDGPRPRPSLPDAAELVARAQSALSSPAAAGITGLLVTESTIVTEPGGAETRTRTERAFLAPDRWRVESESTVSGSGGQTLLRRSSLAISDGAEVLTYTSGDPAAVVSPYLYWSTRALLGTLTAVPGQPRTNLPSDLTLVLQQAGACFTPSALHREPVARRLAAVIDLGTSRCAGATGAAFAGRWTLWIDEDNGLVLRAVQEVGGVARVRAEVEQFTLGPVIDAARFRLEPPEGVPLSYPRPPPLPRPESSPSGN